MAEAKARIKINRLLEVAGWRFFDEGDQRANILLENKTTITRESQNEFGENFEKLQTGFVDYLLLDNNQFPIAVLEAKKEEIEPLSAKEQARKYAIANNCRFIILSNGNKSYFWDIYKSNPEEISSFPTPEKIGFKSTFKPDTKSLIAEKVNADYIALTQNSAYTKDPSWINESLRQEFIKENKLRFLRKYQLRAIERIQEEVKNGKDRFLFEMATGTGKTLTAATVIKLFLRTGNAKRVLFLVDRLELEDQADKAFKAYLRIDYQCCIYKEYRKEWHNRQIVVSTVQSLLYKNKFKREFSPTDFDLVISDEAHRSIGGNARAVFEYFIGYKLGLTATPKDYLKKFSADGTNGNDPRELERRMLLDTYTTFGCSDGIPTFQYSLIHGVRDGFLVNPIVVDARTEITTELLSQKGFSVITKDDSGNEEVEMFFERDFERKFFSETTNRIFCETFLKHGLYDPVTREFGKSIVFCVSQNHALKVTQILNVIAHEMFPGKYNSDFALQVTSVVQGAQQYTINFANNNLLSNGNYNPLYKTSKTRVCVTVGMMTTGYDCPDLLNVALMRPIFSPTEFIQIKGRGTRKKNFLEELLDKERAALIKDPEKKNYKMFDFFANCEYFEKEFNYDEVLKLPVKPELSSKKNEYTKPTSYNNVNPDPLKFITSLEVGPDGMKVDRMYFKGFEEAVTNDPEIQKLYKASDLVAIEKYILQHIFDKPEAFFTLKKLQQAAKIDRQLSIHELIEKAFGKIPYLKSKEELLDDEFEKFDDKYLPDERNFSHAKNYFKSYITDKEFREIIDSKNFALLNTNPNGDDFRKLSADLRMLIPQYINSYIKLDKFIS